MKAVRQYIIDHEIDSNEDSKIVRLVQNTIIDVKKAECFYDGHPGDLLYNATQELIDLAKENKALTKGTLLEPYRDRIINTFTNHKPSLADMNISPKEAVMIYIYLED